MINGLSNPSVVQNQVIIGSTAHLDVSVPSGGLYELRNSLGILVGSAEAESGSVLFQGVHLHQSGWYSVRQGVSEVTRFEVLAYAGEAFGGWPPSQLRKMSAEQLTNIQSHSQFYQMKSLILDDTVSPVSCYHDLSIPYQADPPAVTIPALVPHYFHFNMPFVVKSNAPEYPLLGGRIQLTGTVTGGLGYGAVQGWVIVTPIAEQPPVIQTMEGRAFVTIPPGEAVTIEMDGYEEFRNPLNQFARECYLFSEMNVTVSGHG